MISRFNKEITTERGALKYRLPNVVEGYEFLSAFEAITNTQTAFKVKGNFIAKMRNLVDYESLGYSSFEEMLEDKDNNFKPLANIADEILNDITAALTKKS